MEDGPWTEGSDKGRCVPTSRDDSTGRRQLRQRDSLLGSGGSPAWGSSKGLEWGATPDLYGDIRDVSEAVYDKGDGL